MSIETTKDNSEMRERCFLLIALCLLSMSAVVLAHGVEKTGVLVDARCAGSLLKNQSEVGEHPISCSLENKESGYGIITKGKFYKFDEKGNKQALLLLKSTQKTKNLIVRVEAHFEGDTAKVDAMETVDSLPAS